jgi:hypothetical protein
MTGQKRTEPSSKSYKTRKRKTEMHQKGPHTLERTVAREEKLVLM